MRWILVLILFAAVAAGAQVSSDADHEAIGYSTSAPADPVSRLQEKLDAGEARLRFDPERGYLASLLEALSIPASSQGLVFSRTSLQVDRIAPWSPRAVYFSDEVYVGWAQKGPIIEIASVDPKLGTVFYTLPQEEASTPRFQREVGTCLMCHDSSSITGGVPGLIVRSVFPDRHGYTIASIRNGPTTDRTPIEERWGGWYVTGKPGAERHAGNLMSALLSHEVGNVQHYLAGTDLAAGRNLEELSGRFETRRYLSSGSDVVALLVLAHQSTVHNLITRAGYEARKALHEEERLLSAVGRSGEHLPATLGRIERASEPLVRALLFSKEAPLPGPIEGSSGFAAEFTSRGPRDSRGRSLRDLDLERRVFRYPLSYLIYSESFEALPPPVLDYVLRRVEQVLSGRDRSPEFSHLSEADRQAIREILRETKPPRG